MAGIYLHIPFCTQRCTYCDFYFVTTQKTHAPFIRAICAEIEYYGTLYGRQEPVETIYFGGGTPSLLQEEELAQILTTIHRHFDTGPTREITLEMNPGDADLDYLRGLHALGVNRLSIGVQSFFDSDLQLLNRSHSAKQAAEVISLARRAGFENVSLDLIFGIPGQEPEHWAANLEKAVGFGAPHLAVYGLTVEERTVLHKQVARGLVRPVDEETYAERFRFTMEYLTGRGFDHYEISNYALPGCHSVHNRAYWEHRNYLGFGPSAHSFWWKSLLSSSAQRWANVRNLRRYEALIEQNQLPLDTQERLHPDTLADEYIMLRMRTGEGLDLEILETRYGVDLLFEKIDDLAWLETQGLIEPIRKGIVRLTGRGKLLCDAVTMRLLTGSPAEEQ